MSLRDMFIDIGFNVDDKKLVAADRSVDKYKNSAKGAGSATQKFSGFIDRAEKRLDKFNKRTKKSNNELGSMAKRLAGAALAVGSFSALKSTISGWTDAATDQIEAETKLAAVMKNTAGMTEVQIKGVEQYASKLQGLGIIGDEVSLSATQQLATYQLQADTLKTLMPGMNDLLAQQKGYNATQGDAVTIGNMVGKVMAGQVGALSKAGINFSEAQEKVLKFGTEQERAAMLAEVLQQNVGGVNAAMRKTDPGKIASATNAFGDMREELGKKVLPLQGKFAEWFETKIPTIQRRMGGVVDFAVGKFDNLTAFVDGTLLPGFNDMIRFFGSEVDPRFERIGELAGDLAHTFFPELGTEGFNLKDNLGQLTTDGLDLVIAGLQWTIDNKGLVRGAIIAVSSAWALQKGLVIGLTVAKGALTVATWAQIAADKAETLAIGALYVKDYALVGVKYSLAGAQWALNAAMTANPIGLVIAGVAALGAGFVLLYKKSETARKFMDDLWTGLKTGAEDSINFVIGKVNEGIDVLNKLKLPDFIPGIGGKGVDIEKFGTVDFTNEKTAGQNANGTDNWRGGLTWVGERGKELLNLPKGAQIIPHDKSKDILAGSKNHLSDMKQTVIRGAAPIFNMHYTQAVSQQFEQPPIDFSGVTHALRAISQRDPVSHSDAKEEMPVLQPKVELSGVKSLLKAFKPLAVQKNESSRDTPRTTQPAQPKSGLSGLKSILKEGHTLQDQTDVSKPKTRVLDFDFTKLFSPKKPDEPKMNSLDPKVTKALIRMSLERKQVVQPKVELSGLKSAVKELKPKLMQSDTPKIKKVKSEDLEIKPLIPTKPETSRENQVIEPKVELSGLKDILKEYAPNWYRTEAEKQDKPQVLDFDFKKLFSPQKPEEPKDTARMQQDESGSSKPVSQIIKFESTVTVNVKGTADEVLKSALIRETREVIKREIEKVGKQLYHGNYVEVIG